MDERATFWQSVKEGDVVRSTLSFNSLQLASFAELSGDHNPIHLDEAYARARGFGGRVVYGGLLVAAVSGLLGEKLPGPACVWHSLSLRFHKPLLLGDTAALTATVTYASGELRTLKLRLEIKRQDDLIADGTVQASRAEPVTGGAA